MNASGPRTPTRLKFHPGNDLSKGLFFHFQIKRERDGGAQAVQVVRQDLPTKCTFDLEMELFLDVGGAPVLITAVNLLVRGHALATREMGAAMAALHHVLRSLDSSRVVILRQTLHIAANHVVNDEPNKKQQQ
jgi:hypothetical protein